VTLAETGMSWFGYSVALGDLDGDGALDALIGSPNYDWWTGSYTVESAGAARVWYSTTLTPWKGDGLVHNAAVLGTNMQMYDDYWYDYAGWSVAFVGDVNQDGEDDMAIGAWQNGSSGSAYVVLSSN
jgi:hypothetical protein